MKGLGQMANLLRQKFISNLQDLDALSLSGEGSDVLTFEKEVIYEGTFEDELTEGEVLEFDVDEELIDHWVSTGKEYAEKGVTIPMPNGHTEDAEQKKAEAVEFFKKEDSKGRQALFVRGKFKDLETRDNFKTSGVSLHAEPSAFVAGKTYSWPITHVAFTDYPVVNDTDKLVIAASRKKPKKEEKKMETLLELAQELKIDGADKMTDAQLCQAISAAKKPSPNPRVRRKEEPKGGSGNKKNEPTELEITLSCQVRANKIDSFSRKLPAARIKALKEAWANPETISLSREGSSAFDAMCEGFESLPELPELSGERTGAQKRKEGKPGEEVKSPLALAREKRLAKKS